MKVDIKMNVKATKKVLKLTKSSIFYRLLTTLPIDCSFMVIVKDHPRQVAYRALLLPNIFFEACY